MVKKAKKDRKRGEFDLDAALEAVLQGQVPCVVGAGDRHGTIAVEDPYEQRQPGARAIRRLKLTSLRDDPIGRMYRRRQLECDADRDEADAEARFRSARIWQALYEASEIGGARAIDITRDFVDGGQLATPDTDRRLSAAARLNRLRFALGIDGSDLVRRVLGEGNDLSEIHAKFGAQHADRRRTGEAVRYLGQRLREALDRLAHEFGLKPLQGARGPRRSDDKYDALGRLAAERKLAKRRREIDEKKPPETTKAA